MMLSTSNDQHAGGRSGRLYEHARRRVPLVAEVCSFDAIS